MDTNKENEAFSEVLTPEDLDVEFNGVKDVLVTEKQISQWLSRRFSSKVCLL